MSWHKVVFGIFILLGLSRLADVCAPFDINWRAWSSCTHACGGGTQERRGKSCSFGISKHQSRNCNEFCRYGYPYYSDMCHCPSWRTGRCCETCRYIYIAHCVGGNKMCGGSPDNIKCTRCRDPFYSGGYGKGCKSCPSITNCAIRHCTTASNTMCKKCVDDNVFYKRTHVDTRCERMCSFDNHPCWPGTCSDELTSSCSCAAGFRREKNGTHTTCQLQDSPSINTCQTELRDENGEAVQTKAGPCHKQEDFYGNFQPTSLSFTMQSDFTVDISPLLTSRPTFISEEKFGITDTSIHTVRIPLSGKSVRLETFKQKNDTNLSTTANSTTKSKGNYTLAHPKYSLRNGEWLCIQFEALGGGYVKTYDFDSKPPTDRTPVPYDKTKTVETICYRYDSAKPQHCLVNTSCRNGVTEPLQIENRVTRIPIISLSFAGWSDPLPKSGNSSRASGIEFYEITVNEVSDGILIGKPVLNKTLYVTTSQTTLNLPSDGPRLYCISLGVKDVAGNVQMARRFVLYDSTTNITSNQTKPFVVASASKSTNYKWQTHHNDICLHWKDHFFNKFYMQNSLLGNIRPDPNGLISGIYEQQTGILPVKGTENVYGIIQFHFASSLNGGPVSNETLVPDFMKQNFCKRFSLKDGETYTLYIKAIDIVNNTRTENITVHIDRTVPHINNIGLIKDGAKRLFVHDSIDLSKMNLSFDALDPHSGIRHIQWKFGTTNPIQTLGSGYIGPVVTDQGNCSKNPIACYCPDVGECEYFSYNVPLNGLVKNNTHIGNHNRNYVFTIKATNKAGLSNIERLDVLVDDSPPALGVIYEGVPGTPDIDYTSDDSFIVRWEGFIDHESGIKEYVLGLADTCLHKEELLKSGLNSKITNFRKVPFTESSVRIDAHFTKRKYVSILAMNNAYEASEVACSDGITRDTTPPDLKNITLKHGRWSESLFCQNGTAWLFRSNMRRLKLSDSHECRKRCISDSSGSSIFEILPVEESSNEDTIIGDFICKTLDLYSMPQIVYLPNDEVYIAWNIHETGSQLEDFYVGFGKTNGNSSHLSILDYESTNGKRNFRIRHTGIGSGNLFYAHVKSVNKANLETTTVFGPLLIDETPPYFLDKVTVLIENSMVTIGWNNDTVYDPEQPEGINQMLFQIVHDAEVVSPFLEWRLHDSEPCLLFTGGCLKLPLRKFQEDDTDKGLNFSVKVHAYNNAGHFASIETEKFKVPSMYPPGHALVTDVDPDVKKASSKDISVHFTHNILCAKWRGFRHHEDVTFEAGVGTNKETSNIVPFQHINISDTTCIKSHLIDFNVKYFFNVKASCSGGSVISTSNGVVIVNKTDLLENTKTTIAEEGTLNKVIWSQEMVPDKNQMIFCPNEAIKIGQRYQLVMENFSRNVLTSSNDDILIVTSTYDNSSGNTEMVAVPLREHSCIRVLIDFNNTNNETPSVYTVPLKHNPTNNIITNSGTMIKVHFTYAGQGDILRLLTHETALAITNKQSNKFHNTLITAFAKIRGVEHHSIDSSLLQPDKVYVVVTKLCTAAECIGPIYSQEFKMESSITDVNVLSSTVAMKAKSGCVGVTLSWKMFKAKSTVTIYQWVVSKDRNAAIILTKWRSLLADGKQLYNVTQCINLPASVHSTLYLCIRAYSAAGNRVTTCRRASVVEMDDSSQYMVYDLDVAADSWNNIEQMIHSSNIGSRYTLLHDAELDFGTTNTSVAGMIMYTTERNVTWYLVTNRRIPISYNCDEDTECIQSITTYIGFVIFDKNIIQRNRFYFICAYSNKTTVSRELFTELLGEIESCSNGFIIDDAPPFGGHVMVENTNGFITTPTRLEISWDGFDDNVDAEALGYSDRIKFYSYAVGTRPGVVDITNYTTVGNTKRVIDIHPGIADGTPIFVSIKATDHAGLSSVLYSRELVVDASPPKSATVMIYGKSPYISSTSIEVTLTGFIDDESGIDHFEVGVVTDVELAVTGTSQHFTSDRLMLELSEDIHEGHVYFIIAKAVNRAGLYSLPATSPFILDRSAPTGGHVLDGKWTNTKDIDYQRKLDHIEGHWKGFNDPQSGIKSFSVGLGTKPTLDNIETMVDVGLRTDYTWNGTYLAGINYYITVEACNYAGLCRWVSSDGILLDNSPPISGIVKVGSRQQHQSYLPTGASVHITWFGFADPQSGIKQYEYCIGTKPFLCNVFDYTPCLLESSIIKTNLNLTNGDSYYATVKANNKAGLSTLSTSDAFFIDDTPPIVMKETAFMLDYNAISGEKAQWEKSVLRMTWKFQDAQSQIATHTISLKTHHEGHTPVENIHVGDVDALTVRLDANNWLNDGDTYFAVVTSCNMAGLCSTSKSDNLLIDSSPPHQGGFKPPMLWQNFVDAMGFLKSKITLSWYGFIDAESAIDMFYLTVSRNYTGQELSRGTFTKISNNSEKQENATIMLNEHLVLDELLILSIWAKNSAGLNSSVSKISANVLSSGKTDIKNASGLLEIQKHSCDVHFCNKDCTCAIVGAPCVEVSTNDNCSVLDIHEVRLMKFPEIVVIGGTSSNPQNITASSACLSGHWVPQGSEYLIQRYEWSMGLIDQPVGEGIFALKSEMPWNDVGKRTEVVHCLSNHNGLEHGQDYLIYVKAWYAKDQFAVFKSAPIRIDQSPPHHASGKHIKDSDSSCSKDLDVIEWMDTITACWDRVYTERQGEIIFYYISVGTSINGSDVFKRTNVGLRTNFTIANMNLKHGTRYYVTVTAYNNVGLHTTASSDGFVVDMDVPIMGVVFNTGTHTDTTYQSSNTSFSISWHGFIDHFSGIKSYHAAVVEDSVSDFDNIYFTNVGLQIKHSFHNLSLQHEKSYKGIVKAVDDAGHVSQVAVSNVKFIDTTAPEPFHCDEFVSTNLSLTSESEPCTVSFTQSMTKDKYYAISGSLTGVIFQMAPILSFGYQHRIPLPVATNSNGSLEFEYLFVSPLSGETMFSVSAFDPTCQKDNFSMQVEMAVCTSEVMTNINDEAIDVRQIGPSRLGVTIKIMDIESSLYKIELGAGTSPGGFQLRPLSVLYDSTSGVIDIDTEHGSGVYVTVVAENHAGGKRVFKATPIIVDKTPPVVTGIVSEITNYVADPNVTMQLTMTTRWSVADIESGIKYCICGIGKTKGTTDIVSERLSDTLHSCVFPDLLLQHGDPIFAKVRCINNVELATEVVSDQIIVSTEATQTDNAKSYFIVSGNGATLQSSISMSDSVDGETFIQSDNSKVMLEWSGFEDFSGVDHYEYRLTCRNDTFVDWRSSGKHTMIELKGLHMLSGNRYKAEVRAINSGQFKSDPVKSNVVIHSQEPKLTGKPLSVTKVENKYRFDWSGVFQSKDGLLMTYDVMIGSKQGYTDILQLQHIDVMTYDVMVPTDTITTPAVKELFVVVTGTYSTGLYSLYQSMYKI